MKLVLVMLFWPIFAGAVAAQEQVHHNDSKITVSSDKEWLAAEKGEFTVHWTDDNKFRVSSAFWVDRDTRKLFIESAALAPEYWWKRIPEFSKERVAEIIEEEYGAGNVSHLRAFECSLAACYSYFAFDISCQFLRFANGPHGRSDEGDKGTAVVTVEFCAPELLHDEHSTAIVDMIWFRE